MAASTLGILAGVLISLGVIWTKGVKPVIKLIRHIHEMYDILVELAPNDGEASIREDARATRRMMEEHLADTGAHRRITEEEARHHRR
jgi:hypothetical protein